MSDPVIYNERYELVRPLRSGGMASVWLAKLRGSARFARTCVIKRVLAAKQHDADAVELFIREAQLCALLNHRNIIQVFDFGECAGEYFLAMEFIEGRDLHRVLRAMRGELPPIGAAAFVIREVCRALAYAHAMRDESGAPLGLVHRDVSPSNVLIGEDGSVKLLDFGIAKALMHTTSLTQAGTIRGKLSYMSPEQVIGDLVDARTDVFAAGIMLHELLCSRRLFHGEDEDVVVDKLLRSSIAPPSAFRGDVAPALDEICRRALQRDVDQRFQGADEMAAALDPIVRDSGWDAARLADWVRTLEPASAPSVEEPIPAATIEDSPVTTHLPTWSEPAAPTTMHPPRTQAAAAGRSRRSFVLVGLGLLIVVVTAGVTALARRSDRRMGPPNVESAVAASPSGDDARSVTRPALEPASARIERPAPRPGAARLPHRTETHVPAHPIGKRKSAPAGEVAAPAARPKSAVESGAVVDPFSR